MEHHRHDINCGHGMRAVPVSPELLTEFLQGRTQPAETLNVPADLQVVYSMKQHGEAIRSKAVILLCFSSEWDRKEDYDPAMHDVRLFIPEYRRTA
jgi:hypothetical protein